MLDFALKVAPYFFGAVIVIVLGRAGWLLWFRNKSRHWPSVRGKVKSARIVGGEYPRHDDGRRDEYFDVEVEYQYSVRGKAYVATRFSFGGDRYSTYDDAMAALRGIAAGREVPVYYDPARPERAVLRKA